MLDARNFNFYGRKPSPVMGTPAPFSPFAYLALLLPIPIFAWYWAGQALHKLELQWVRAEPGSLQSLAEACQTQPNALCGMHAPVDFTHSLALALVLFLPKFMFLVASMPHWPQRWQRWVLQRAALLGGIGLIVTFLMVVARGVVATLTAWFMPLIWLGNDTYGVQLAAIIGLIAIMRIPRHMHVIWLLSTRFERRRTGREASREEAPALWTAIDQLARKLGIPAPERLVLGLFPDCRLTIGKMTLDPTEQVIEGRILYLGATLAASLPAAQLQQVVEQALVRSRGKFGAWLPAVEDWLDASQAFLKDLKERRAQREIAGAADPAILCRDGWLLILRRMADALTGEHAFYQKLGIERDIDTHAPRVRELLANAVLAYRKDTFHLLIVDLTCGIDCPPAVSRFAQAFAQREPSVKAIAQSSYISQALIEAVTLAEKEWLIKTGQASTPTDCWELRAA